MLLIFLSESDYNGENHEAFSRDLALEKSSNLKGWLFFLMIKDGNKLDFGFNQTLFIVKEKISI